MLRKPVQYFLFQNKKISPDTVGNSHATFLNEQVNKLARRK